MGNRNKGLLIVMPILLLKITCNKSRFIAFNGAIRAGLNLIDHLHVGMAIRRVVHGYIVRESILA
jgi:hypothetical protein